MKTGIYGGTFNPIHNGHLHIVEEFRRGLGLDRVLLIPTRVPPHKAAPDLASAGERLCHVPPGRPGEALAGAFGHRDAPGGQKLHRRNLGGALCPVPPGPVLPADGRGHVPHLGPLVPAGDHLLPGLGVHHAPQPRRAWTPCAKRLWSTPGSSRRGAFWSTSPTCPSAPPRCARPWPGGEDVSGLVPQAVAAYMKERGLYRPA